AVVRAFDEAPNGGISLHLSPEDGPNLVDEPIADPGNFGFADIDQVKYGGANWPCSGHFGTVAQRNDANCAGILAAKRVVFRYALFGGPFREAPQVSGVSQIGGPNFYIAQSHVSEHAGNVDGGWQVYCVSPSDCFEAMRAGTFMHELGH